VIDVFIDELDLGQLGFGGVDPKATGRPSYHPSALLKLYIYGYLNRFQSSRRLEREAGRNVEVMWLTGRLVPDHKTIADFRKDNGRAIRQVCTRFVALCRTVGLFAEASVAIDGSKFKAINNRDKNFTRASHQGVIKKDPLDSEGISNPIDITALSTCQRPRKTTTAVIARNDY
jgi:transposase